MYISIKDQKYKIGKYEELCPNNKICKGVLKIKEGKYGKFKGCSKYPNCNFSEDL